MNREIYKIVVDGDLQTVLPGYHFADSYGVNVGLTSLDAPQATATIFSDFPTWVRWLLSIRDRSVAVLGLKAVPKTGFPVLSETPDRVVLGMDDRHLDLRLIVSVSPDADGRCVAVTTLVRFNNRLGRAYLTAILPMHRLISRAVLSRAARRWQKT